MPKIIISDTSTLILFKKIEQIDLLEKVYDNLVTTPEVAAEFGDNMPEWVKIQEVGDHKYQLFLETQIDKGEASAIALAMESDNTLLLLDDLKARKLAAMLKLKFTDTLGIINKAKQLGHIDKVKPLIDKILETNFRISQRIINEILIINGELHNK